MTIYITGLKNPRNSFPSHEGKEFLSMSEYLKMAKNIISHIVGKKNVKLAYEMMTNEDVISNIATCIMIADWRFDESKGKRSTYRFGGAIHGIQSFLKFRRTKKPIYSIDYEYEDGLFMDSLIDDKQKEPIDIINHEQTLETIEKLKSSILTEKEAHCIQSYFFENMTYQEIGDSINLTKERVRQIINESLTKLRKYIND